MNYDICVSKPPERDGDRMGHSLIRGCGAIRSGPPCVAVILVLLPGLIGQAREDPAANENRAAQVKHERVLEIYAREADEYTIYRDASRAERLELQRKPIYIWSNPLRASGQDGAVFIWTCRGRAEVVGTFFSFPAKGPRGSCTNYIRLPRRCWT